MALKREEKAKNFNKKKLIYFRQASDCASWAIFVHHLKNIKLI